MAKVSSKKATPVRGGGGHMVGKQSAGPAKPMSLTNGNKGGGGKWAKGGSTKMFGFSGSKPSKAC